MSFLDPNQSLFARAIREAAEAENIKKSLLLGGNPFSGILGSPIKRRIFISYHHENDQYWANLMKNIYADKYEIFYDNSLDDKIDSDDPEYINRVIREDYIVGTSVTIVLCGAETGKRRFVDWEIYSTLQHEHAVLGIALPTASNTWDGKILVPDRLYDNITSGYAHWISWTRNVAELKKAIEIAFLNSSRTRLINNSREKMKINLT